jgi:hypothetical protein
LAELLSTLPGWLADLSSAKLPEKLLANSWYGTPAQSGLGVALFSWLLLHNLSKMLGFSDDTHCLAYLRQFGLDYAWQEIATSAEQERDIFLTTLLMQTTELSPHPATSASAFAELCNDPDNSRLLGINTHADETWFLREGMTALAGVVALQAELIQLMQLMGEAEAGVTDRSSAAIADILRQRLARAAAVGYRLDKFLSLG